MTGGCKTCGAILGRRNKSGYCRKHVAAANAERPEIRERQREGIRRKLAADPAYLDDLRKRARNLSSDPEINLIRSRHFVANRIWEIGHVAASNPESRAKAGQRGSATKLAWCPRHLREEYRYLVHTKRLKAAAAREIILAQHEADMQRWRRGIGVAA